MKTRMISTTAVVMLLAALTAGVVYTADAATPPSQPASRELSPEQLAARKAMARANWEALSREEKAARKGHKNIPQPPAKPAKPGK